jgi:hypothetical protein
MAVAIAMGAAGLSIALEESEAEKQQGENFVKSS